MGCVEVENAAVEGASPLWRHITARVTSLEFALHSFTVRFVLQGWLIRQFCQVSDNRIMLKLSILFCLLFSTHLLCFQSTSLARAEQDEVEDEAAGDDDLVDVEDDEAEVEDDEAEVEGDEGGEPDTEEDVESLTAHPDTTTAILFSSGEEVELTAGKVATSYIHFANTGSKNFIMTGISGSFRYPQDYSYFIQNFTTVPLNKMIDAGKEGSFVYEFMAADMAAGRPFGLVLNLDYKDTEDNLYQDTVFNKTVTVQENDEGVDAETFFMYVVLATLMALGLFGLYGVAASKSKTIKRATSSKSAPVEMGTTAANVDYSWIPQDTLKSMNKGSPSPRRTRNRAKRSTASETE